VYLNFKKNIFRLCNFILLGIFIFPIILFASTTDGTILTPVSTDGYAWGENVGWINFGTAGGNIHITSTGLTGYAWDSIYGWINLNPTGSGVVNDGQGNLSGFAWSEGVGFIDFTGVSINSSGKFTGQAYGAQYGRINFDCSTCNVVTDWRTTHHHHITPPPGTGIIPPTSTTTLPTATTTATTTLELTPASTSSTLIPPGNPPTENNETPSIPNSTNIPNNPVASQPIINQSGLPITNNIPGKTFTTQTPPATNLSGGDLLFQNLMKIINDFLPKIKKIFSDVKKFIATPQGSVITKSISTLGIISSLSVPFVSVSFSDLWLMLLRFIGLLLGAIGLKKKSRQWGTVYDSITKRPLDPVYVSLINSETGKEVTGSITDIDGRYGFLVLPGKYRLEAKKTNYIQPSKKMAGKSFDEVYNDLYFGEDILVTEEGQIITKNIPMDSLSFDWNEFAKTKMNVNKFIRQRDITWAKISSVIFFIGAIVAFIALIAAPEPYNYIIAGIYIFAYILNYSVFKTKKAGTLTERLTKAPLSFAIVSIFREGETVPLTKKIADKFGAYYVLLTNGKYYIKVEKKNNDGSYTEIFQSPVVYIKNGLINENLAL
jgi:hypothetical protein